MHFRRLEQRILKGLNRANRDFSLIDEGDRLLVALSGGKDSYGLLWALRKLQAAAPFQFEIFAFHLDQGQPGHDAAPLREHLEREHVPFEIEYQDTYSRVIEKTEPGKVYCSLCSRFRRAILYKAATRHGCNKVALGHHRDDTIETLLLNIFYSGQIKAMPPKLVADGGEHQVIRPLIYVPEDELIELSAHQGFPILPCRLCGSQEAERKFVKNLLVELSAHNRHLRGNLLAALGNVHTTHLLDPKLNPLLAPHRHGDCDGDVAEPQEPQDNEGTGKARLHLLAADA